MKYKVSITYVLRKVIPKLRKIDDLLWVKKQHRMGIKHQSNEVHNFLEIKRCCAYVT